MLAGLDASVMLTALNLQLRDGAFSYISGLNLQQDMVIVTAFMLMMSSVGLYNNDASHDFRTFFKRFFMAWQAVLLPTIGLIVINKGSVGLSFTHAVGLPALAICLFMSTLFVLHGVLVWCFRLPFMKRRIVVLGEGAVADGIVAFVRGPGRTHSHHLKTISHWRSGGAARSGNLLLKVAEPPALALSAMTQALHADEIVVAVEERRGLPVAELLECKLMGVAVIDALTFWEREAGQIDPAKAGDGWLTFSGGFVLDRRRRVLKRSADLIISLAFLTFVLPLLLLTALAIRLEGPGPIFYRQERVGLGARTFQLWKFRSMRPDAERDGVPRWANAVDDRITRVGRFIRKVRIDEIPQVLNVLAGEMSFIGPRPERPFFVDQLRSQIPHYDLRHRVRPGITGWAQVNYPYGASVEDAIRKLSYDLYYVKKNDLLLDLAILMQTVRVVLFANGAR